MDCEQANKLLSPFLDGELPAERHDDLQRHLCDCSDCAAALAAFEGISKLSGQQSEPQPPSALWSQIERRLDNEERAVPETTIPRPHRRSFRGWLTVATLLLVAAGVTIAVHRSHDHGMMVDYDGYLAEFSKSPDKAFHTLLTRFESQPVDLATAEAETKCRPALANGLPEGYSLESVHLVKMPCCACIGAICETPDGNKVTIMEHAIDQPQSFGNRPCEDCQCNGINTRVVHFNGQIAATWKHTERAITVIGVKDMDQLADLMAHLTPTSGS